MYSGDKADHAQLALNLTNATGFPVAVPNYRLTPKSPIDEQFHHPGHAEDILVFLEFILSWGQRFIFSPVIDRVPNSWSLSSFQVQHGYLPYDGTRLYLMGHSCSAHILASIFLDTTAITPSLTPSDNLLKTVQAIIMSEGIYDLELLLARFPAYRSWFIADAFGDLPSYAKFSMTEYPFLNAAARWLVIHSKGDTLVDVAQSHAMAQHLRQLKKARAEEIQTSLDHLERGHDDILNGDNKFVEIVSNFILTDASKYKGN